MAKTEPKRRGRPPKLTLEQRVEVRRQYGQGVSAEQLAVQYGVCFSTIRKVLAGRYAI